MAAELTSQVVATFQDAAKNLKGAVKRAFQARVARDDLGGSPRRTETVFGRRREARGALLMRR